MHGHGAVSLYHYQPDRRGQTCAEAAFIYDLTLGHDQAHVNCRLSHEWTRISLRPYLVVSRGQKETTDPASVSKLNVGDLTPMSIDLIRTLRDAISRAAVWYDEPADYTAGVDAMAACIEAATRKHPSAGGGLRPSGGGLRIPPDLPPGRGQDELRQAGPARRALNGSTIELG